MADVSSAVSAILLDAGGVLIFPQPDLIRRPLQAAGVTPDTAAFVRAHYQAMVIQDLAGTPPAAGTWWHEYLVGYLATKQALAQELLEYFDRDAPLFQSCRASLYSAGQPLLDRAQHAQAVRADTDLMEIIQIVGGIAKIPAADPEQTKHMLAIALDGLRYRPAAG